MARPGRKPGHPVTEESRQKMREAKLGRQVPEETVEKISKMYCLEDKDGNAHLVKNLRKWVRENADRLFGNDEKLVYDGLCSLLSAEKRDGKKHTYKGWKIYKLADLSKKPTPGG